MAVLPIGDDGSHWVITDVDNKVLVIKNPGQDDEVTILRLDVKKDDIYPGIEMIKSSSELNDKQKSVAGFWYGYFYAHLSRTPTLMFDNKGNL